ncbi:hypothetical protein GOV04_03665 [Candidatus Woesearchaeota archaeon]|nr:hypothetical protein [Candidatus Woesearchaeota archaeon]
MNLEQLDLALREAFSKIKKDMNQLSKQQELITKQQQNNTFNGQLKKDFTSIKLGLNSITKQNSELTKFIRKIKQPSLNPIEQKIKTQQKTIDELRDLFLDHKKINEQNISSLNNKLEQSNNQLLTINKKHSKNNNLKKSIGYLHDKIIGLENNLKKEQNISKETIDTRLLKKELSAIKQSLEQGKKLEKHIFIFEKKLNQITKKIHSKNSLHDLIEQKNRLHVEIEHIKRKINTLASREELALITTHAQIVEPVIELKTTKKAQKHYKPKNKHNKHNLGVLKQIGLEHGYISSEEL